MGGEGEDEGRAPSASAHAKKKPSLVPFSFSPSSSSTPKDAGVPIVCFAFLSTVISFCVRPPLPFLALARSPPPKDNLELFVRTR